MKCLNVCHPDIVIGESVQIENWFILVFRATSDELNFITHYMYSSNYILILPHGEIIEDLT